MKRRESLNNKLSTHEELGRAGPGSPEVSVTFTSATPLVNYLEGLAGVDVRARRDSRGCQALGRWTPVHSHGSEQLRPRSRVAPRQELLALSPLVLRLEEGAHAEHGGSVGPIVSPLHTQLIEMFLDLAGREVLGHEVRRVLRARDLHNAERLVAYLLLQPQVLDLDVAELAQPLSVHDAQRGAGIRVNDGVDVRPKIAG